MAIQDIRLGTTWRRPSSEGTKAPIAKKRTRSARIETRYVVWAEIERIEDKVDDEGGRQTVKAEPVPPPVWAAEFDSVVDARAYLRKLAIADIDTMRSTIATLRKQLREMRVSRDGLRRQLNTIKRKGEATTV